MFFTPLQNHITCTLYLPISAHTQHRNKWLKLHTKLYMALREKIGFFTSSRQTRTHTRTNRERRCDCCHGWTCHSTGRERSPAMCDVNLTLRSMGESRAAVLTPFLLTEPHTQAYAVAPTSQAPKIFCGLLQTERRNIY